MSRDSNSSTSSISDCRKRKLVKKSKRKLEKKHKKQKKEKRHKQKKRSRLDSSSESEVTLVQSLPVIAAQNLENADDLNSFGPALPPHLLQIFSPNQMTQEENKPKIIGPFMPSDFKQQSNTEALNVAAENTAVNDSSDDENNASEDVYGPMPVPSVGGELQMSAAQIELEQRALQLKLAAIDGTSLNTTDQNVREEWMLELPEVGLNSGLAALSNMKRTFHQGKERPDFSDRSGWTKTPQSESNPQKPTTSKSSAETLKKDAEVIYVRQRDEEQESIAKKHKKKHKRDESLVEIHQKKLRKEQKRREKELAASGTKPERRPFSRDVDLKLNKIDKNQTKQIVDKAKILNTKFASGHTKYL